MDSENSYQQETRSLMNEEKDDEFKLSELNTQILRQMLDNDESAKITKKVILKLF